jgi:dTDP-4-dehydrorhamnose reductase
LSNQGKEVKGFQNAIYTGFPTIILADILANIIEHCPKLRGLYHVSSEKIDKFSLLKLINKEFKTNINIIPDKDFRIDRSLDSTKFRLETKFNPIKWSEMIKIMAKDAEFYKEFKK